MPREVRDRDYFYLWSFSAWSVWAALGLVLRLGAAGGAARRRARREMRRAIRAPRAGCSPRRCFSLAIIPLFTNWSAASRPATRSRATGRVDLLNCVEPYGVLITNGDNDTFPLWYAQEVEGVRKDVMVAVTSLLQHRLVRAADDPSTDLSVRCGEGSASSIAGEAGRCPRRRLKLTLGQADALPEVMPLPQAQLFKKDSIEAVIPAGDIFKDQIIVLRSIQDSYPNRPMYFTSGSYPRALGLSKVRRDARDSSPSSSRRRSTRTRDSRRFRATDFFDLPGSDSLWKSYQAPGVADQARRVGGPRVVGHSAALRDHGRAAERPVSAARRLRQGAQFMDTAIKLARVARVEDVLGFSKEPRRSKARRRHQRDHVVPGGGARHSAARAKR